MAFFIWWAYPENYWPKDKGTASCVWVRPIFMISLNYSTSDKNKFYFSGHFAMELFQTWNEKFIDLNHCCNVNDCWERIIWRLTHVYMIIWMDKLVTKFSSKYLSGSVCNYFICIHVWLRPWTGLPNNQRELIVPFARNDLISSLNYRISYFVIETKLLIDDCCTFF